jgi:hypothetical protein
MAKKNKIQPSPYSESELEEAMQQATDTLPPISECEVEPTKEIDQLALTAAWAILLQESERGDARRIAKAVIRVFRALGLDPK